MDTLPKLLKHNAETRANQLGLRQKYLGIWEDYTWKDIGDLAELSAAGLLSYGVQENDVVAVIGSNSYALLSSLTACQSIRAIPLPIYSDLCGSELEHMLNLTQAKFAIVRDQQQVDALLELDGLAQPLKKIIYVSERSLKQYKMDNLSSFEALKEAGRNYLHAQPEAVQMRLNVTNPEDTAFIMFTSGVNVYPKAVKVSHRIALHVARSIVKSENITSQDRTLSFMPISTETSLMFGYAVPYVTGMSVGCPENTDTILTNLHELNPTVMCVSPKVYQYFAESIQTRIKVGSGVAKRLYDYYMNAAVKESRAVPFLGQVLVVNPILDLYGLGCLRIALVGEGPIDEGTHRFFRALGIGLRKIYGNAETMGYISKQTKSESVEDVGYIVEGMEVKIAENGEILCRGENVVDGFFNDDEATQKTFKDGWHHTGDVGELKPNGLLIIHDRVDAVVKTDKITYMPKMVEEQVKASLYIKDVFVDGGKTGKLVAVVVINKETVGQWADSHDVRYTGFADLATKKEVQQLIGEEIVRANNRLNSRMQPSVEHFILFHRLFTPSAGETTWMSKLRRPFLQSFFQELIVNMQHEAESVALYDPVNKSDVQYSVCSVVA